MAADYHLEDQEEECREAIAAAIATRAAELIVLEKMPRAQAIENARTEFSSIEDSRPENVFTDANGNAVGTAEHTPIPTPKPTKKQAAQIAAIAADLHDD